MSIRYSGVSTHKKKLQKTILELQCAPGEEVAFAEQLKFSYAREDTTPMVILVSGTDVKNEWRYTVVWLWKWWILIFFFSVCTATSEIYNDYFWTTTIRIMNTIIWNIHACIWTQPSKRFLQFQLPGCIKSNTSRPKENCTLYGPNMCL